MILSLHPMIDLEKKIVCINIKQSFSKILEYKNNPMMQNCFVPIVGYREVDSTVTLHENDIILLSGFIQIDNFENSNKNGVFQNVLNIKNSRYKKQLSELMIFIRVKFF